MTYFYLSPTSLSLNEYKYLISEINTYGWKLTFKWSDEAFQFNYKVEDRTLNKLIKALSKTDVFITTIPSTFSGAVELGIAYSLCEEVIICAKKPKLVTQTGMADALTTSLPRINKLCCKIEELPVKLKHEYINLVESN